jgi:hypothetical protein
MYDGLQRDLGEFVGYMRRVEYLLKVIILEDSRLRVEEGLK